MSCNVSYTREGISGFGQTIACAGTDYSIKVSSLISCEGNAMNGRFREEITPIEGTLYGLISGNRVSVKLDAPGFKGHFNLAVKGREQTVEITQRVGDPGKEGPLASMRLWRKK
jgi:hypothetical protein